MLKFINSIEMDTLSDVHGYFMCGIHFAYVEVLDDGMLNFEYKVNGVKYSWIYFFEELENAIWEWLCTLSRATNPSHCRVLGSLAAARVEAA